MVIGDLDMTSIMPGLWTILPVCVIGLGYVIGCISTGYYLVKWRMNQDIRTLGSGAAGARNVGRILGQAGFVSVLLGDALKGAIVIWIAQYFQSNSTVLIMTTIAVVAGHIWPVQLGFRGGKGLATGIGAIFAFAPLLALAILLLAGLLIGLFRQQTTGALGAVTAAPLLAFLLAYPTPMWSGTIVLVAMVLYAHRQNVATVLSVRHFR